MATTPQNQQKLTTLESIDKLDHLRSRLAFIMNSLPGDWIDEAVGESLYYTIDSIWDELGDVREAVCAEIGAQ